MTKPQIVIENLEGYHNSDPNMEGRLARGKAYKDVSTICIVPTRGVIPAKVVQSWMAMMTPMNNKFTRMFVIGMEVGAAYSETIEMILANEELSKWKYILTLEEDNMPPPDGLLRLIEGMDEYDAVGGLYWTKGQEGQPMIYGNPKEVPKSFFPQMPENETLQQCNGLGMGFTLFRLDMFKDERIARPWFKTEQSYMPGQGSKAYTQDLYFFENAAKFGYKFACDTRVKVGHYDYENDIVW
jgi:hypothetical protein